MVRPVHFPTEPSHAQAHHHSYPECLHDSPLEHDWLSDSILITRDFEVSFPSPVGTIACGEAIMELSSKTTSLLIMNF